MGCFNSIYVKCPECGTREEVQSKSGDCSMSSYSIYNVPLSDLAYAIEYENPFTCDNCFTVYEIVIQRMVTVQVAEDED